MNLQTDIKTSYILFPCNNIKPTRKGKTLIDHINSNISSKLIHCNVISTDEVSDHMSRMRYSVLKKNAFKKNTNMYEMRKTKYVLDFNNRQLSSSMHLVNLMIRFQFSTN